MTKHIFDTPAQVAEAFAEHFIKSSKAKAPFHIALSGGSTPKLLFDLLAEKYNDQIDWSDIHLWWGDERCVAPDDDDSNYKMTKEHLLDAIDIAPTNIHRVKGEDEPKMEATRYGHEIKNTLPDSNGLPQFDMIILGMGADGHTASIFPHEIHLLDDPNTCAVATHPDSGQVRVTLTGDVINNAREVAFLVTGASKAEKVKAIFEKTGDYMHFPAAHISPSGTLHWFLDKAAVAE